jgi:esterase/lipase superfamily enzyme
MMYAKQHNGRAGKPVLSLVAFFTAFYDTPSMVPTVWCSGRYFLHGKIQKATVLRTRNSAVTPCYGKTSICATNLIFFFRFPNLFFKIYFFAGEYSAAHPHARVQKYDQS